MNIYPIVAKRLLQDPTILDKALGVLDRWDAKGVGYARRRAEWRRLIQNAQETPRGFDHLIDLLLDTGEQACRLKDFAPFAGVLSRDERREAVLSCTYDH